MTMMHLVADENWAVTMATQRKGGATTHFLFGGGICILSAWCFGTLIGHRLGAVINNPETYALDFAFIAVFTALAFSMWQGKRNLVPWISAAILAVITEKVLPGKWYVLTGGMGGAFVAVLLAGEGQDG